MRYIRVKAHTRKGKGGKRIRVKGHRRRVKGGKPKKTAAKRKKTTKRKKPRTVTFTRKTKTGKRIQVTKKDVGKPGLGPKGLPKPKKGALPGYTIHATSAQRWAALKKAVNKAKKGSKSPRKAYVKVFRQVQLLMRFNKRFKGKTMPKGKKNPYEIFARDAARLKRERPAK